MLRNGAALAVTAVLLLTACGDKAADNAVTDTTAMMMGSTTAAMASPAALSDANIVALVSEANRAEIERGTLASDKGTAQDVKDYGMMVVNEHKALQAQAEALATKLGVTPMMPAGDQSEMMAKQQLESFNSMAKGAPWDKAYTDYEITYHQQLMATVNTAIAAAQNAELKDLLNQAVPAVQKHLDMAKAMQSKMM